MERESRKKELAIPVLTGYAETFFSRDDLYAVQNSDGSYRAVKQQLTLGHLEQHIRGHITLGAYALSEENKARWVCFDADEKHDWYCLFDLANSLREGAFPYLERSRRGGHMWLFFDPIEATDARAMGRQLLTDWGLQDDVELFPKQSELVTGPGSLVRLPLGVHQKTKRRYYFVGQNEQPIAPTIRAQMALLASPQKTSKKFIANTLERIPAPDEKLPERRLADRRPTSGETLAEKVKSSVSVVEFVSRYVELDSRGRSHCPFHDDQHKSFQVNAELNFWNCYADCGGGSIINFWMKMRELNGEGAGFVPSLLELKEMLL